MSSRGSLHKSIQGFTLIELLVTIAVLAVVAAIAAPAITTQLANRRIQNAASELQSSILQARAIAANTARPVEMWPAYNSSWNVSSTIRGSSISLPNSADVSANNLISAKLSWYVVTAGASTGTGIYTIATSTTNTYPIQVSLPDQTVITATSTPTTTPSVNSGLRFLPTGGMGNITASGTQSTTFQVTFTVCDTAVSKLPGYTIVVSPFGGVRSSGGATCP